MKKNKKQKEKRKSVYKTPVLSIRDNIVFTNKGAWAYFKLTDKPYEFLSVEAKEALAQGTATALSTLVRRADENVDCHLIVVNVPFEASNWEKQMYQAYNLIEANQKRAQENLSYNIVEDREVFDRYIMDTADELYSKGYMKRVTYLGVKLFIRGSFNFGANPLEIGLDKALETYKNSLLNIFSTPDERISKTEEERARAMEKNLYQNLHESELDAVRPTAEELLLTMKRRYYPAMPTPYLEVSHSERVGLSDIAIETGGEMLVKPRYIEMKQFVDGEVLTGYRSTLTIASFPKEMYTPSSILPFFSRPEVMPYTCSARFILKPAEEMKKERQKKVMDSEDEVKNFESSGQRVNQEILDTMSDLELMDMELTERKEPWVVGSYRISIEENDLELVEKTIKRIQQNFKQNDIVALQTTGDQLNLFREEQIGGEIEIRDFQQVTNLAILSAAGINHGGSVGDPIDETMRW